MFAQEEERTEAEGRRDEGRRSPSLCEGSKGREPVGRARKRVVTPRGQNSKEVGVNSGLVLQPGKLQMPQALLGLPRQ